MKPQPAPSTGRLAYPAYYWPLWLTALSGLVDAAYLAVSHYRVHTDLGYKSFCAISKAINCETVSQSPYSILLGVPIAWHGVAGYLLFLAILHPLRPGWERRGREAGWMIPQAMAIGFCLASVGFALVSILAIQAACLLCLASYAVNGLLLYQIWMIRRRFPEMEARTSFVSSFKAHLGRMGWNWTLPVALLAVATMLRLATGAYWETEFPPLDAGVRQGVTEDGHPWIGAESPRLTIVEFADYQCFQCRKTHEHLRRLVAAHPESLRLVHRHFPMDHQVNPLVREPFHQGAGKLALLAIAASEAGRFWEVNDLLFQMQGKEAIQLVEVARQVGLEPDAVASALKDLSTRRQLNADIAEGLRLGITGTPGFVIDGTVYEAMIPPDVLSRIGR